MNLQVLFSFETLFTRITMELLLLEMYTSPVHVQRP